MKPESCPCSLALPECTCCGREEDQSQGLTLGEALYAYGGIVIAFVAFCSGVLWLCGVGR